VSSAPVLVAAPVSAWPVGSASVVAVVVPEVVAALPPPSLPEHAEVATRAPARPDCIIHRRVSISSDEAITGGRADACPRENYRGDAAASARSVAVVFRKISGSGTP
jgi:hypothetical protein